MVEEQKHLGEFIRLGVTQLFTNSDGVIVVEIPEGVIQAFVDIYLTFMLPGRWNEYVGPTTGFYFKLATGETKHIVLTPETQKTINLTLKEFVPTWKEDADLWSWLASLDIYKDYLS